MDLGEAGAGKTKLTSMVVDHILETTETSQSHEALACIYCDPNQTDRQDPAQILQSLVLQLSTGRNSDFVQPCLVEVYERKQRKGPANPGLTEADCVALLHQLAEIHPQMTLVLDALDEADKDKRAGLIDVLDELVASSAKPVTVFISSRHDLDIKRQYELGSNVSIEATDNGSDISAFVAEQIDLYEKRRRRKIRSALRKGIVHVLQEKRDGM
jgi:Cdc6-like AAA superfamily ATPase